MKPKVKNQKDQNTKDNVQCQYQVKEDHGEATADTDMEVIEEAMADKDMEVIEEAMADMEANTECLPLYSKHQEFNKLI